MLTAQLAADNYSDIRWHAYCRATIAGTLGATSRLIVFSLSTYINKYIYIYMCICIYAWKRQVACIHSLYTHQYIYIYMYMYMNGGDKSLAFSLYTYMYIYKCQPYMYYKYIAQRLSLELWERQVA